MADPAYADQVADLCGQQVVQGPKATLRRVASRHEGRLTAAALAGLGGNEEEVDPRGMPHSHCYCTSCLSRCTSCCRCQGSFRGQLVLPAQAQPCPASPVHPPLRQLAGVEHRGGVPAVMRGAYQRCPKQQAQALGLCADRTFSWVRDVEAAMLGTTSSLSTVTPPQQDKQVRNAQQVQHPRSVREWQGNYKAPFACMLAFDRSKVACIADLFRQAPRSAC